MNVYRIKEVLVLCPVEVGLTKWEYLSTARSRFRGRLLFYKFWWEEGGSAYRTMLIVLYGSALELRAKSFTVNYSGVVHYLH